MITIGDNALGHVVELMMSQGLTPDTHFLRVGVKGGGCSGLSYIMDFDEITPLTKTPTTKETQSIETTKVLDKYYNEEFLKNYFEICQCHIFFLSSLQINPNDSLFD